MTSPTASSSVDLAGPPSFWLASAQLLRLPNVLTAMADICLAALAVGAIPTQWERFFLVLFASASLYLAGMVWNDVFDVEEDRRDRPFRPLPSGRVSIKSAIALGVLLVGLGLASAAIAGRRPSAVDTPPGDAAQVQASSDAAKSSAGGYDPRPLIVAVLLTCNIFFYDAWLKHIIIGPVAMGGCRFFNILLGLSIAAAPVGAAGFLLALVVGIYIAGVTWFARTEARESNRISLLGAAGIMILALALALYLPESWPTLVPEEVGLPRWLIVRGYGHILFPYLLVAFALFQGLTLHRAIRFPTPGNVQAAVKRGVLGLILLDTVLAVALAGPVGLLIAALFVPAWLLGKLIYST